MAAAARCSKAAQVAAVIALLVSLVSANSMVEVNTGDDTTFVQLFVEPLVPIGDGTTSELTIRYASNVVLVGYVFFLSSVQGNLQKDIEILSVIPPIPDSKPVISTLVGNEVGVVFGGTGALELPGGNAFLDPIAVIPTIMCMTTPECQVMVAGGDPDAKQVLFKLEVVTPDSGQVFLFGPGGQAQVVSTEPIDIFLATPTPAPMPMPSMMTIKSDPHFTGLHGQNFDFTGEPGRYYALISDYHLVLNAKFSEAYTTGIHTDVSTMQVKHMHNRGTWISELAILIGGHLIFVSVENPASRDIVCPPVAAAESRDYLENGYHTQAWQTHNDVCFFGGHSLVDGQMIFQLGSFELDEDLRLVFKNSRSFGRVHIISEKIGEIEVDYVPPPAEWKVHSTEFPAYSHLNVAIPKIAVTQNAHGVLGQTARLREEDGIPVLESLDANGMGLIDGSVEDYELGDIFQTSFKFSAYKSSI